MLLVNCSASSGHSESFKPKVCWIGVTATHLFGSHVKAQLFMADIRRLDQSDAMRNIAGDRPYLQASRESVDLAWL